MAVDVLRKLGARWRIASAVLPVLALGLAVPVAAQFQSEGYKFLEAVKKKEGQEVTDMLAEGSPSLINTRDLTSGDTGLHIVVQRMDDLWVRFLLQRGAEGRGEKGAFLLGLLLAISLLFWINASSQELPCLNSHFPCLGKRQLRICAKPHVDAFLSYGVVVIKVPQPRANDSHSQL